jgi:hypothetical protein
MAGVPCPFSRAPVPPQLRQAGAAGEVALGEAKQAAAGDDRGQAVIDHQGHPVAWRGVCPTRGWCGYTAGGAKVTRHRPGTRTRMWKKL